ncbi:MAG TPA: hypothetical protein VLL98_04725 [Rickettsiales bacterium]|nr:hypothetical protein [Rickettsiales bacterium]
MWKLFNLSFAVLFLMCSCSSRLPTEFIQKMEEEDNNLCIREGVQYEDEDTREIYWRCRLRVMDQRIADETQDYGYGLLYQRDLKRLRRAIKNRRDKEKELAIAKVKSGQEEKEHNYCILLEQNSTNKVDANDYFECRKEIASIRQNNKEYLNLDNEHMMQIFQYNDTVKQTKTKTIEEECVKYATDGKKLKQCQEAMEKANKCIKDRENDLKQRKIDDKIYCTKLSIEKYPDSLSKFDNDSINYSFGPKVEKIKILELRDNEYNLCIEERNLKFKTYSKFLENECKKDNLN